MMTAETHVSTKRRRARGARCVGARGARKWHHVDVKHDRVSVIGGYNPHSEAAACIQYQMPGNTVTHTFVALDKNATWFLKGVGGVNIRKGDLKPVQVIDMIRHTFNLSLPGETQCVMSAVDDSVAAAVAGTASQDSPEQDIDPMDQMDELAMPRALRPKRKHISSLKASMLTANALFRMQPQRLEVPTRPPCAAPPHLSTGPDADDHTEIWVYQSEEGRSASRRHDCGLFLRSDSIGWLLNYAADELEFHGAVSVPSPDGGDQSPNCAAVDGLNVEWSFDAKAWEAMFLAGEKLGTQLRVCVKDLNRAMWQQLYNISKVDGYFSNADYRQRKYATREFLVLLCLAIAGNKPQAIGLQAMIGTHGTTRGLEGTAVADCEDDAAVADEKADESDAALSDQDIDPSDLESASGDDSGQLIN